MSTETNLPHEYSEKAAKNNMKKIDDADKDKSTHVVKKESTYVKMIYEQLNKETKK